MTVGAACRCHWLTEAGGCGGSRCWPTSGVDHGWHVSSIAHCGTIGSTAHCLATGSVTHHCATGSIAVCVDRWKTRVLVSDNCVLVVVRVHTQLLESSSELGVILSWGTLMMRVSDLTCLAARVESVELFHGLHRQRGEAMMQRLLVVDLMDGNGSMNGFSLEGLLVDDGLHKLMHVMMDMLTDNHRHMLLGVSSLMSGRDVFE